MARPTIIVGLGGTGQWVLTWLKRDLQLANKGELPNNVKLIEIDTCAQIEAGATRVIGDREEQATVVGGVALSNSEYIYLGGDVKQISERVQAGAYPQIGSWYQANTWLSTLPQAALSIDEGAGRIRQLGRLAVFKDLLNQEAGSKLWSSLQTAFNEIRSQATEEKKVEVILVGSFAGGTGSGLFIDIALLLRHLASTEIGTNKYVIRGFFALPNVFSPTPDIDMKARSFAAWRELNRFMVVNPFFPMPDLKYVERNDRFNVSPNQRIFDACYLVDGKRAGQHIAAEAKFGAFPVIAEAISALIDGEAGAVYSRYVTVNLAPEYVKTPELPMYSAIGAYSVQVPADYVEKRTTHASAQKIILKLLTPQTLPDEKGKWDVSGANRHLSLASSNKNLEDRGTAGRTRSRRLLRETIQLPEGFARPTLFFGRISQVVEQCTDSNKRQSTIDQLARAGAADPKGAAGLVSWRGLYTNLGDDPNHVATQNRINEYMSFNVKTSYERRKGEKEEDIRPRLREIPELIRRRFGGRTNTGEDMEEFFGECGEALENVRKTQLIIFKQLVKLNLQDILVGRDADPVIARTGKLGYAWDLFDGLVAEFNYFQKVMADVKERRDKIKPELQFEGMSKQSVDLLNRSSGKKVLFIFEHWDVKGAEMAYLDASQRVLDLRREDILHFYVTQTASEMQSICESACDEIKNWIHYLSTGEASQNLPGFWETINKESKQLSDAHSWDTRISSVQKVIGDQELEVADEDIVAALKAWGWKVDYAAEDKISITAQLQQPLAETPLIELLLPIGANARNVDAIQAKNVSQLFSLSKRSFANHANKTTVSEEIKDNSFYGTPQKFSGVIVGGLAEPLFDGVINSPRKRSNFIRVQASQNDPYFYGEDGVEGELRSLANKPRKTLDDTYAISVVNSENPYKLTIVRTDDLYDYNSFSAWDECKRAYEAHFSSDGGDRIDPSLMHIFPAEARAVAYEKAEYKKTRVYNEFHSRVVMMLEDITAFTQFFYLLGFKNIEEKDSFDGTTSWEMNFDGDSSVWLTKPWNASRDLGSRPRPDLFNAIHGYVIGRKNNNPENNLPIDYKKAQSWLDAKLGSLADNQIGRYQEEVKFIDLCLSEKGFIGWIKRQSEVVGGEPRKDFSDLARIVNIIFNDRKTSLNKKIADSGSYDTYK